MENKKNDYFYNDVLLEVIKQAERTINIFEVANSAFGHEETENQKRTRNVYEQLIKLKEDYEQLTTEAAFGRFREIIDQNPAVRSKTHCKGKITWWKTFFRRMGFSRRK